MTRLFGTDGVRGVAGEELDERLAVALGRAGARFLGKHILIGRDSRLSGPMLEDALCTGIALEGGKATVAGIVPTPAIAYLTSQGDYDCGIVISASHNPPEYNGIKFFSGEGFKIPDALEDEMQTYVEQVIDEPYKIDSQKIVFENAAQAYVKHSVNVLLEQGIRLDGVHIALDCAHGAACETTPAALEALGAQVDAINTNFDGSCINVECGSTHLEPVIELMHECGADIALAHDGDADRMLAVAPDGSVVDGDFILAICAADMKARGQLSQNMVVGTVMSNLGFKKAMEREGIEVVSTKVGDRYVLEAMREKGAVIGGEQSGHVIFLQHNTTGDGLMTALQLLAVVAKSGKSVNELMNIMQKYPQALVNIAVKDKALYATNSVIAQAVLEIEHELEGTGRLLVRPSGTEPLIRVMVEAQTQKQALTLAQKLGDIISKEIGV